MAQHPMDQRPRITFGIIVLNGEPFTKYCLRQIYPFAHQIIVVEGATFHARAIAGADGHSRDGTRESLRAFKENEDPENKVIVVTAEDEGRPNGFWPGEKDEMSEAYARRATGDYLWQVDVDEFYTGEDMEKICRLLARDPEIAAVSFRQTTFWGSFDVACDCVYPRAALIVHRLFRWKKGFRYATHRPVTVVDEEGRDLRSLKWLTAKDTEVMGVRMLHYSLLFPQQVREKCAYYSAVGWESCRKSEEWAENCYFKLTKPFRVHNMYTYLSWLKRYAGPQPEQILALRGDIEEKKIAVEMRDMRDTAQLLASGWYRAAGRVLEFYSDFIFPWWNPLMKRVRGVGFRSHLRRWLGGAPGDGAEEGESAPGKERDSMTAFLRKIKRRWKRFLKTPRVRWGNLRRLQPVSSLFGFDRGKPIDRYYIEQFLARHTEDIRGRVLEIAENTYTLRFGGARVAQSDVLHAASGNPRATLVGDLTTGEGIPENAFDCMILTQTYPFIYDFRSAVANTFRALKPGGVLLATFAGISHISRYDMDRWGDYWRFTSLSARKLFEEHAPPENLTIETRGNVLASIAFLHGLAAEDLRTDELEYADRDYELILLVRAVKPEDAP